MKVEKLAWVPGYGGNQSIFSVHFHPDGSRFVTSQGPVVQVWRTQGIAPWASETKEKVKRFNTEELKDITLHQQFTDKVKESICTITDHSHNVSCVRFSPDGKYLACCSDDGNVSIYERKERAQPTRDIFGEVTTNNDSGKTQETWEHKNTVKQHEGDVRCVEWSPDSRYLLSGGVDNRIVVFDMLKESVIKIMGSKENWGMIKGLAFDPIGTYVAAQLLNGVLIFETRNWNLKVKKSDCYSTLEGTVDTMFYRPSWAPNGMYLATTNGKEGRHNIAPMYDRQNNFETQPGYQSHGSVSVAMFNPNIFRSTNNEEGKEDDYHCIVATGCATGIVTIWSSKRVKPMAIINYFFHGVTDLAWSPDGYRLLATSKDGTIFCVELDQQELGVSLNGQEKLQALSTIYGENAQFSELFDAESQKQLQQSALTPVLYSNFVNERQHLDSQPSVGGEVNVLNSMNNLLIRRDDDEDEKEAAPMLNTLMIRRDDVESMPTTELAGKIRPRPAQVDMVLNQGKGAKRLRTGYDRSRRTLRLNEHVEYVMGVKKIEYHLDQDVIWSANLNDGEQVGLAVANDNYTAFTTHPHNNLHLFTVKGRRIMPPLLLEASPLQMVIQDACVLVLTELSLKLFNGQKSVCQLDLPLDAFMVSANGKKPEEVIASIHLTSLYHPYVTLSNGLTYIYAANWKHWLQLPNDQDPEQSFMQDDDSLDQLELQFVRSQLLSGVKLDENSEPLPTLHDTLRSYVHRAPHGRIDELMQQIIKAPTSFPITKDWRVLVEDVVVMMKSNENRYRLDGPYREMVNRWINYVQSLRDIPMQTSEMYQKNLVKLFD